MIKFNVGQTYSERFMSDHDSVAHFTIHSRTDHTITTDVHGKRVVRRTKAWGGIETFKPFGTYSMCMIVSAKDKDLSK